MEEIRSNSDRVWETADAPEAPVPARLPGARKRTMPEMFTVEKAQLSTTVPEGSDWLHEIKYDGYRLLAFVRGRNIRLLTQRGNNWTNRFPSVREALRSLNLKSAILDGETTVLTAQGTTDFQKLQNALHGKHAGPDMVFFVFDVPYFNGYDLTHTPLILRKEALKSILMRSGTDSVLQYSEHVRGKGKEFFDFSCGSGLEGVVSKKADSFYRQERSNDWLKIKCKQRQEFVIGGFTDPAGDRAGFGALLLGVYDDDGKLKYCGKMGTGFTQSSLMEIHRLLKKSEQRNTAFADPPRAAGVHWTAPVLVAEVEFREWTDENRVRMAAFKGLREDKSPRSVHREKAAAEPVQKRKQEKNVVAGVHLSHPQKIMFPDQSLTKQDLAEYYERVAEWILPHIVNRPLMLVRCPEGQNSACFHQKHVMPSMPDSIRSATMMDKGESARLICIDDLRGLIALVQLGTLEFHPWGSPADHPETPDRLIFDLDPSEQVNWPDVMAAARSLRDLLAALELKAFVRTTGGKGLHVVCPLHGRLAWQTVKAFSGAVAHEMVRAYPEQYIATMNKRARAGKIFIDYFRNERGATAIASYSTRAREGAPVAAPLAWSELRPALKRDQLTAFRLPRRLGALKTDPWEGFMESGQTLNKTALRAMGVK
jgi:bifunctional non-homologous end joining protein LigD